ncbi:MAG: beta-lactamase family protein [Candidatus Hydrogenedentes bacterium]|nr:beta-lactamase family protein [Candidatus Hydrogenedentota bacterium]
MWDYSIGRRTFCLGLVAGGLGAYRSFAYGAGISGSKPVKQDFDVSGSVSPESVDVDPARLEAVLQFVGDELKAGTCPGAAFSATRYGKTFVEHYWGSYACAEREGLPCSGEVQFPLYSFTKSITATVAAMVQQDGLLTYEDPVAKYNPDFAANGKEGVTLRHLLTHSAGIPSIPLEYVGDEESWQKVIAGISQVPLEWEPGSKTAYHAISGMLLVADVVRRVSDNKPWSDICSERVFVPLETDGFTLFPDVSRASVAVVPPPKSFPSSTDREHFPFLGHPSGGAHGRMRDILALLNLNLNSGVWKGEVLLKPETLAEMHRIQYESQIDEAKKAGRTPVHEYWGLGWLHRGDAKESWFGFGSEASPETYGHAGIDTVIGVADPTRGLALAFVTSGSPGNAAATMRLRNGVTNRLIAALTA